jgi:hypothetical protein
MNASARSANRDDQRQQLAYVYFENEPSITHVLVITKNTNQRPNCFFVTTPLPR